MSADVHALAGAYVLDALDDSERRRFEEHLADCPACAEEIRELRGTAARLGATAAEPPPPELRARVLAQVDRTRQMGRSPRPARAGVRRGWMARRLALPVALAGSLVVLAFGVVLGRLGVPPDQVPQVMTEILAAPDATVVQLTAPPGATARFIYSESIGEAVLIAEGLAPAPPGQTYELWLIGKEGPAPAGLFAGGGVTTVVATGDVSAALAVGVTIEPEGGSPQPTGDILLAGEL